MASSTRRRLTPWFVGVAIVVAADVSTKYVCLTTGCQAPGMVQFLVLAVMPVVYLALAFLAFRSQP